MTAAIDVTFDDPVTLAAHVAAQPRPMLVGLDVDGVLAPLVDHAAEARLLDGMADAISRVAALDDVHVVVISGRSIDDLERFGFGDDVSVIGSHGMETRNRAMSALSTDERTMLATLDELATRAASAAGDGAWVERKPASVVLHVRQADAALGRAALDELAAGCGSLYGASVKGGSNVLELFARAADKGTAMVELRSRLSAVTTVFVGDDLTDEDAFAQLSDTDVAIKVGIADTIASHRLADPAAVLQWLTHLAG